MNWQYVIDGAIIVGMGIGRSVAGWAVHALEDNKISKFELKQLVATVVRVGILGVVAYTGFAVAGVDNAAVAGAVAGFVADKLFGALKENKNVK